MTYTDVRMYNKDLRQYIHVGLPGIVYRDMTREEQIETMRKLTDPEMAELLEKYNFVVEGVVRHVMPNWIKTSAKELREFMQSYPTDITITLPDVFLVRDLSKIYDILSEYDDEPEYFSWDKDTVLICGEPSDIAECIKGDILMLYPEVTVEIERQVDPGD